MKRAWALAKSNRRVNLISLGLALFLGMFFSREWSHVMQTRVSIDELGAVGHIGTIIFFIVFAVVYAVSLLIASTFVKPTAGPATPGPD